MSDIIKPEDWESYNFWYKQELAKASWENLKELLKQPELPEEVRTALNDMLNSKPPWEDDSKQD